MREGRSTLAAMTNIHEFGATSTADDVLGDLDLKGKNVLVTGVSAGLGVATAQALLARGAAVVGTARDLAKARRATAELKGLELIELDLASLASVRACADGLLRARRTFDVVIANAGVMAIEEGKTKDGFETQLGTNHLGHFVLVNRILPLVREGGRIVILSSSGHSFADVSLDDPGFTKTPYDRWQAYGRSKTANILFAVELDRRHRGRGVRTAAVHPGVIFTELGRHLSEEDIHTLVASMNASRAAAGEGPFVPKSPAQGIATTLWAGFVAPADAVGGRHCEDCHVAEIATEGLGGVRPYAIDPERAKALWATSEELVGERFV